VKPETDLQQRVVKFYRDLGCEVYVKSQPRRTMQTPGIPDLKVFCERKGCAWHHETKTPEGKQSKVQMKYQRLAEVCGETYILGGMKVARVQLKMIGVLVGGGGA